MPSSTPRFNPHITALAPPPVPAVQAWARGYDGSRGRLIDLSQAVPGYPAHPDMLRWLGDAASAMSSASYGPIEGDAALRQAYAAHAAQSYGAAIEACNIHITAGCNQAFIAAVMALAGAGDTVLLSNPFYFNHETSLAMLGIRVETFDCAAENGFVPDLAQIAAALHPGIRVLALVSPNNPTGAVYPATLLAEIFRLCRDNGTWLILDETYRDFRSEAGPAHGLFAEPDWEGTFIGLYSFSKAFCIPGHRLGAITAGRAAVAEIAKVMDNIQICAPRAAQQAVARAIPALADWRRDNAREIGRRAEALKDTLASLPEWRIEAVGAYFAFVRHPFEGRASSAVAEYLARELGVLSIPGEYFGRGQAGFLRFAFANADGATIRTLAARLADATPPEA